MKTNHILIGVVFVLFVLLGYFVHKSTHGDSAQSSFDVKVFALEIEKDSLKRLILDYQERIAQLDQDTDSILSARIEIKKEYIYLTRDYATVYSIIDTYGVRSAQRFWSDRYGR